MLCVWLLVRGQTRKFVELAATGVAVLGLDLIFNSAAYGHLTLPLANYYRANVGGLAAGYGVTPFYFAFELLWRFVTEPVCILIVATAVLAARRLSFVFSASVLFFLIHALIGHKEYRFFYGAAVLLSTISAAVFQGWLESKPARGRLAAGVIFLVAFLGVATFRAEKKVAWGEFEIPSKLETLAGAQPDVRGLIVYGWNGVHSGGHFTFHQNLPYDFSPSRQRVRELARAHKPAEFNYVINRSEERAPCAEPIREEGGAVLYRCTADEVERLF